MLGNADGLDRMVHDFAFSYGQPFVGEISRSA